MQPGFPQVRNIWQYRYMNPGGVFSIGQDALAHPQHSNGKASMHTIIRKPEMYYSDVHHRWLGPSELLNVHNFPVFEGLGHFGLRCSFNAERSSKDFPERRRNAILHQVGNGMSLCTESLGFNFVWAVMAAGCPHLNVPRPLSSTGGSRLVQAASKAQSEAKASSSRVQGKRPGTDLESRGVREAASELRALMKAPRKQ